MRPFIEVKIMQSLYYLICLSASLKKSAMSFHGVVFLRMRLQFTIVSKYGVCFFSSTQPLIPLFFMTQLE